MTTLAAYLLGEHSDLQQSNIIREQGYAAWWREHVAPATAAIRRLGRDPIVIHRFPGAAFGSFRVTLADFLNVRGTDWAATVRKQTMPAFRWPRQEQRKPVEYRAYLSEPEVNGDGTVRESLALLRGAGCGAYFEGVTDTTARGYARVSVVPRFFGCEPVWDRAHPIAWEDPCIVSEELLTQIGADFHGNGWPAHWLPLAPGQKRTLIMDDAPTTMAAILEREAEGWSVACYGHRLVEMAKA